MRLEDHPTTLAPQESRFYNNSVSKHNETPISPSLAKIVVLIIDCRWRICNLTTTSSGWSSAPVYGESHVDCGLETLENMLEPCERQRHNPQSSGKGCR